MFPAGQFLLGLQLEGRDGWDQGTTGTDRYIGSIGGPQPAVSGAEMDSVLSKVRKCVLYIHVCVCVCVCACVCACMHVYDCTVRVFVCACVCGVCVCVYVWV